MQLDFGLVFSTMIVIIILATLGTTLMFWTFSDYRQFNVRVAIGIGLSIGLILAAIFLMWILPQMTNL